MNKSFISRFLCKAIVFGFLFPQEGRSINSMEADGEDDFSFDSSHYSTGSPDLSRTSSYLLSDDEEEKNGTSWELIENTYNVSEIRALSQETKGKKSFLTAHCSALLPLVASLESEWLITKLQADFLQEINQHIDKNTVSMSWLWGICLRYAGSIKSITGNEIGAFCCEYPEAAHSFKDFVNQNQAPFQAQTLAQEILNLSEKSMGMPETKALHRDTLEFAKKEIFKHFPSRVILPLFGKEIDHISHLVLASLDNFFPIKIPSLANDTAYNTSPLSAMLTDLASVSSDSTRLESLVDHILKKTDEHVITNGSAANPFIKLYAPCVVKKYNLLIKQLKTVHGYLSAPQEEQQNQDFKKAMLGFYLITRVCPCFIPEIYNQRDFVKILEYMVEESKLALFENPRLGDPDDSLQTSPIDGKSVLTEAEIFHNQEGWDGLDVAHKEVNPFGYYNQVTAHLKSGKELNSFYPTLLYRWQNVDQGIDLLEKAGIILEKPQLDPSSTDSRKIALKTLYENYTHFDASIAAFLRMVTTLPDLPKIEAQFSEAYDNIEKEFREELEIL